MLLSYILYGNYLVHLADPYIARWVHLHIHLHKDLTNMMPKYTSGFSSSL